MYQQDQESGEENDMQDSGQQVAGLFPLTQPEFQDLTAKLDLPRPD